MPGELLAQKYGPPAPPQPLAIDTPHGPYPPSDLSPVIPDTSVAPPNDLKNGGLLAQKYGKPSATSDVISPQDASDTENAVMVRERSVNAAPPITPAERLRQKMQGPITAASLFYAPPGVTAEMSRSTPLPPAEAEANRQETMARNPDIAADIRNVGFGVPADKIDQPPPGVSAERMKELTTSPDDGNPVPFSSFRHNRDEGIPARVAPNYLRMFPGQRPTESEVNPPTTVIGKGAATVADFVRGGMTRMGGGALLSELGPAGAAAGFGLGGAFDNFNQAIKQRRIQDIYENKPARSAMDIANELRQEPEFKSNMAIGATLDTLFGATGESIRSSGLSKTGKVTAGGLTGIGIGGAQGGLDAVQEGKPFLGKEAERGAGFMGLLGAGGEAMGKAAENPTGAGEFMPNPDNVKANEPSLEDTVRLTPEELKQDGVRPPIVQQEESPGTLPFNRPKAPVAPEVQKAQDHAKFMRGLEPQAKEGESNAAPTGGESTGNQQEHLGISQGGDVRGDQGQVGVGSSEPTGGGGGSERSPEVGGQPAPEGVQAPAGADRQDPGGEGEVAGEPEVTTSIKNAVVEASRARRGESPLKATPVRPWEEGPKAEADQRMNADSRAGEDLQKDLAANPRATNDTENFMLLRRRMELSNALEDADNAKNKAAESGDPNEVLRQEVLRRGLSDELLQHEDVTKKIGGIWGQSGSARKALIKQDFSLGRLEAKFRADRGGAPAEEFPKEFARLKDQAKQIKDLQEKLEKSNSENEEIKTQAAMDAKIAEMKMAARGGKIPGLKSGFGKNVIDFATKQEDAARARLKERAGTLRSSISPIPPEDLADYAVIGAAKLARGAAKFAEWSADMVKDFGEKIRPHLKAIFEGSLKKVDEFQKNIAASKTKEATKNTASKMKARLEEGENLSDLGGHIQKIARGFVEDNPNITRDELVKSVHEVVKGVDPNARESDTRDAISGYGQFKQLKGDEIDAKLRDLKGQLQQVGKMEDMAKGTAPKKTGIERRTPSDEERRLISAVNEEKRKGGFNTTDPATQLKSALQTAKTRMENQMKDMRNAMEAGKPIPGKTKLEYDAETNALKVQHDALKDEYNKVFGEGAKNLTDEQRSAMVEKSLDRQISDLEKGVPKKGMMIGRPDTAAIAAKRARLEALRAERDLIIGTAKKTPEDIKLAAMEKKISDYEEQIKSQNFDPTAKKADRPDTAAVAAMREKLAAEKEGRDAARNALPMTKGRAESLRQTALKGAKTRMLTRIAELEEKKANRDFAPTPKKAPLQLDQQGRDIQTRLNRVKNEYLTDQIKFQRSQRSGPEKAMDIAADTARAAQLLWPTTLVKLPFASAWGISNAVAEEVIQSGVSLVPGLRAISKGAPTRGGLEPKVLAKAFADTFTKSLKNAKDEITGRQMDVEHLYGEPHKLPPDLSGYPGRAHAALKSPLKQFGFSLAEGKLLNSAKRAGEDISDPAVRERIGKEALTQAKERLLLNPSKIEDVKNAALNALERPDKLTGRQNLYGKAAATGIRVAMPITKIPSNQVLRAVETSPIGLGRGLAQAFKGAENLTPAEKDLVIRHIARGVIGTLAAIYGYKQYQKIGPFFGSTTKKDQGNQLPGEFEVGDTNVPSQLTHTPAALTAQTIATARRIANEVNTKTGKAKGGLAGTLGAAGGLAKEIPEIGVPWRAGQTLSYEYQKPGVLGGDIGSQFIPGMSKWFAKHYDKDANGNPVRRAPDDPGFEGFIQRLEMDIPGLRKNVPLAPAHR